MKLKITLTIAAAVLATATPTHAAPPPPLVEVQVDCAGIAVTTAGWPEGSDGIIGLGSSPPWGAPINDTWTYPMGDSPVGLEGWFVLVRGPGQVDQTFQGTLDCRPVVVATQEPPPVVEIGTALTFEPSVLFPGLELADPW